MTATQNRQRSRPRPDRVTRQRLRIELDRGWRPFMIWVSLLGLGVVCAAGLLVRLHIGFGTREYVVHIAVPDASGVTAPYSEVSIAGVRIGNITAVTYTGSQAVLTAAIDPADGPLYRNARLTLQPNTPLQDMYLNVISRGSSGAGTVPNGGSLAVDHTTSAVSFSEVLDIFNSGVRPRLTELLTDLGQGLSDHGAQLRATLVELGPFLHAAQGLAGAIATRKRVTERIVHNLGLMTQALAQRSRSVEGLVASSSVTAAAVATVDRPLGSLIDDLPVLLRQLPTTLNQVRSAADQLNPALVALHPAVKALAPALSSLTTLGADALAPIRALEHPLPRLARLFDELPSVTKPLGGAFAELTPQAPRLQKVSQELVPCRSGMENLLQRLLSVFKYSDSSGAFARVDGEAGVQTAAGIAELPYFELLPTCSISGIAK